MKDQDDVKNETGHENVTCKINSYILRSTRYVIPGVTHELWNMEQLTENVKSTAKTKSQKGGNIENKY